MRNGDEHHIPLAELERTLIDDFIRAQGHDPARLADLPQAERDRLLKKASVYASGKLEEVESRAHLLDEIRHTAGNPDTE